MDESGEYADPYEREKVTRDWIKKPKVAANVVQDFTRRAGNPAGKRVLDVGFGNGLYAAAFARVGAKVSGLEVNKPLAEIGNKVCADDQLEVDLRLYDGNTFPYESESFDYVYTISVVEHVTDPVQFMREIARVLKPGGALYITFPNRYAPRETHTGVYFLGYLPRTVAAVIMKTFFKRNTVEEINLHFFSFFSFRRMVTRAHVPLSLVFETTSSTRVLSMIKRGMRLFGVHQGAVLGHTMLVFRKS
jgi:2-polyprenyl-3-methyl-5-hydroxy-6-metoxy-1,4-benzoquinol methylase